MTNHEKIYQDIDITDMTEDQIFEVIFFEAGPYNPRRWLDGFSLAEILKLAREPYTELGKYLSTRKLDWLFSTVDKIRTGEKECIK